VEIRTIIEKTGDCMPPALLVFHLKKVHDLIIDHFLKTGISAIAYLPVNVRNSEQYSQIVNTLEELGLNPRWIKTFKYDPKLLYPEQFLEKHLLCMRTVFVIRHIIPLIEDSKISNLDVFKILK